MESWNYLGLIQQPGCYYEMTRTSPFSDLHWRLIWEGVWLHTTKLGVNTARANIRTFRSIGQKPIPREKSKSKHYISTLYEGEFSVRELNLSTFAFAEYSKHNFDTRNNF